LSVAVTKCLGRFVVVVVVVAAADAADAAW
jgi:hypothetical protein